jgi:site-specific DNA-methyltransferase (adenine-specific)
MIKINLMKGDCLERMKEIPDKSVDMVLTDPPYGTTACKWDSVIPFKQMWTELKRVSKDNSAIALFGSEPFSSALRMSNIKNFKYDWYWYKNCPTGISLSRTQPMRCLEAIHVFSIGRPPYFKQLMKSRISDRTLGKKNGKFSHKRDYDNTTGFKAFVKTSNPENILLENVNPRNVLEFSVVPRAKGTLHPTQKPVALLEYLVKTYTIEGETVLDFTMGSGSTGVACKNLNRNFVGIERDDKYFEIAKARIENA